MTFKQSIILIFVICGLTGLDDGGGALLIFAWVLWWAWDE